MTRTIPEWIGRTDDSIAPPRVKLRILDRQRPEPGNPPLCACGCQQSIREGDAVEFDHTVELADGGENREFNLRALIAKHHKRKTAKAATERADRRAHEKRAFGIKKASRPIPGSRNTKFKRKMNGTTVLREEEA